MSGQSCKVCGAVAVLNDWGNCADTPACHKRAADAYATRVIKDALQKAATPDAFTVYVGKGYADR